MQEYLIWVRMDAPLQSWGLDTCSYEYRGTGSYPSFSGVLGFLCASLGISFVKETDKVKSIRDSLKIDIHVLSKGTRMEDFQGAGGWVKKDCHKDSYESMCIPTSRNGKSGKIYRKEYLQDSKFDIVLRTCDVDLKDSLIEALKNPKWFVFAGRKACHLSNIPFGGVFSEEESLIKAWEQEGRNHEVSYLHSFQREDMSFSVKDFPMCQGSYQNTLRYVKQVNASHL